MPWRTLLVRLCAHPEREGGAARAFAVTPGSGATLQTFTLGPARLTAGCVLSQHHFPQDMQVPSQDTQAHIPLIAPLRPVPTATQAIARLQGVDR